LWHPAAFVVRTNNTEARKTRSKGQSKRRFDARF
jgi:hypothetical protein